jgi:hypothetical protein
VTTHFHDSIKFPGEALLSKGYGTRDKEVPLTGRESRLRRGFDWYRYRFVLQEIYRFLSLTCGQIRFVSENLLKEPRTVHESFVVAGLPTRVALSSEAACPTHSTPDFSATDAALSSAGIRTDSFFAVAVIAQEPWLPRGSGDLRILANGRAGYCSLRTA